MRILFIGDVFAKPGRQTLAKVLPRMKEEQRIDLVLANVENSQHGKGVTDAKIREMMEYGVDFFTGGNHIWKLPEIYDFMEKSDYPLVRPANYPGEVPGRGYALIDLPNSKKKVLVINLLGQVYMSQHTDNPFHAANRILQEMEKKGYKPGKKLAGIIVDFHAEASAEKIGLASYLDGKVSLVAGTHTHVQTADERILPHGTAFITDVGMVGVIDSMIGLKKEDLITGFLNQLPARHEPAEGETMFSAVMVDIDETTGLAEKIERIQIQPINV
jgi:metallophosphoesterase (TIGR00282 family)